MSKSKKKKHPNSSDGNSKDSSVSKHQDKNNVKEQLKENRNEPETKTNMEANHPMKNFKNYISEFIMIFVAITGGFFMENMREHVVEHRKEKEYIVRLVRDIKKDTTNLKDVIKQNRKQIKGLDSLAILVEKPISDIDPKRFITLLIENLNDFYAFTTRDVTMSQLKNTGGLRLIKNSTVSDRIVFYYSYIESGEPLRDVNMKFVEESFKKEMTFINFNQIEKNQKLNITDVNKMKELGNRCFVYKSQIGAYNRFLKEIYKQDTFLLKYLKKEYNLKE